MIFADVLPFNVFCLSESYGGVVDVILLTVNQKIAIETYIALKLKLLR